MASRAEWYLDLINGKRRGVAAWLMRALLWWARFPYAVAVRLRNFAFDRGWKQSHDVGIPIICVGNLTLGGTGKTPMVEYVARFMQESGWQVAIVSRGYGADQGPNDEAMLLEENLPDVPHLQGVDRVATARLAIEELECGLIVLDDGFQHRRLKRTLDIVLLDATRPIQDEYVLPRGTLREPVSALRRASVAVLSRCDQASPESVERQSQWLNDHFPNLPVLRSVHKPIEWIGGEENEPIERISGQSVAAFSGIGRPDSFHQTLESLGARVVATRTFADHHNYTKEDVVDLATWASNLPAGTILVTTQKDWVKLRVCELGGRPLRALRVGMQIIQGEDQLIDLLSSIPQPAMDDA